MIPDELIAELWAVAEGEACGISLPEFAVVLAEVGAKCNYGMPADSHADPIRVAAFYRGLRIAELVLAQACALGRETAWQRFLALYRAQVTQAAVAITRSTTPGHDLADSLYSELFGLKQEDGIRISPLASYSGRGSLLGWLRATLAQRHIDHHRRTHRETPLEELDVPMAAPPFESAPEGTSLVTRAVSCTLATLEHEDRFLLVSYFLDQRTLLQMARMLKVHEATVSRRLKRLTADLRKLLLANLQSAGLSRRAAEEALGADPRDIEINLRLLLQTSQSEPFTDKTKLAGPDPR